MSELSKRASKYFFIQGLKYAGFYLLIYGIVVLEWIIIGSDKMSLLEYVLTLYISLGAYLTIFMNFILSLYGPNWYDSLVLSMGARRKDIFVGELIKQGLFVCINYALIWIAVIVLGKMDVFGNYVAVAMIFAIIAGPVGLILGHTIKKFGKVAIMIMGLVAGLGGAFGAIELSTGVFHLNFPKFSMVAVVVIGLVIFVALEFWANKLNKKSMVR